MMPNGSYSLAKGVAQAAADPVRRQASALAGSASV
jgi:hypothetical protein